MCKAKKVEWTDNDMVGGDCFRVNGSGESFGVVLQDDGTAMCSCDFEAANATCSHVTAARRYAGGKKFRKFRAEQIADMLAEAEEMEGWENE